VSIKISPSSSSSYICHGVGPLVNLFWSHVSRSLFKGLPWFLLPVGEYCFNTLGNRLRGILFTCCIHFLLYSSNLSKISVIFKSFEICVFFYSLSKCILLLFSSVSCLLQYQIQISTTCFHQIQILKNKIPESVSTMTSAAQRGGKVLKHQKRVLILYIILEFLLQISVAVLHGSIRRRRSRISSNEHYTISKNCVRLFI
jgi:hypothetical protein